MPSTSVLSDSECWLVASPVYPTDDGVADTDRCALCKRRVGDADTIKLLGDSHLLCHKDPISKEITTMHLQCALFNGVSYHAPKTSPPLTTPTSPVSIKINGHNNGSQFTPPSDNTLRHSQADNGGETKQESVHDSPSEAHDGEPVSGGWRGVVSVLRHTHQQRCSLCNRKGAGIRCAHESKQGLYHPPCLLQQTEHGGPRIRIEHGVWRIWCARHAQHAPDTSQSIEQWHANRSHRTQRQQQGQQSSATAGAPPSVSGDNPPLSTAAPSAKDEDDDDSIHAAQQTILSLYRLLKDRTDVPLDMTYVLDVLEPLMTQFEQGWTCALLGSNGVGKSFLINLLIFLTKISGHRPKPRGYVLEAFTELIRGAVITDPKRLPPGVRCFAQSPEEVTQRESGGHLSAELAEYEQQILSYFKSPSTGGSIQPYLLPSFSGDGVTTKCVIRVRRGRVFHFKVKYLSEARAKQYAFSFVQQSRTTEDEPSTDYHADGEISDNKEVADTSTSNSPAIPASTNGSSGQPTLHELNLARARFEHLTGISGSRLDFGGGDGLAQDVDWGDDEGKGQVTESSLIQPPETAADIELADEIKSVLGQVHVYAGRGWKADGECCVEADRCYIRDQLARVLDGRQSYAIEHITVYVPARIVSHNSTILDMPGTNDEDPINIQMTMDGVNEADMLLVLPQLGRMLSADSNTQSMLRKTHFLRDVLMDSDRPGRLAILHYVEARAQASALEVLDEPTRSNATSELRKDDMRSVLQLMSEINKESDAKLPLNKLVDIVNTRCSSLRVMPTLFTSLLINNPDDIATANQRLTLDAISAVIDKCKGYDLVGLIHCLVPQMCGDVLQQLAPRLSGGAHTADESKAEEASGVVTRSMDKGKSTAAIRTQSSAELPTTASRSLPVSPLVSTLLRDARQRLDDALSMRDNRVLEREVQEVAVRLQGSLTKKDMQEATAEVDKRAEPLICVKLRQQLIDATHSFFNEQQQFFTRAKSAGQREFDKCSGDFNARTRERVVDPAEGVNLRAFPLKSIAFTHMHTNQLPLKELESRLKGCLDAFFPSFQQLFRDRVKLLYTQLGEERLITQPAFLLVLERVSTLALHNSYQVVCQRLFNTDGAEASYSLRYTKLQHKLRLLQGQAVQRMLSANREQWSKKLKLAELKRKVKAELPSLIESVRDELLRDIKDRIHKATARLLSMAVMHRRGKGAAVIRTATVKFLGEAAEHIRDDTKDDTSGDDSDVSTEDERDNDNNTNSVEAMDEDGDKGERRDVCVATSDGRTFFLRTLRRFIADLENWLSSASDDIVELQSISTASVGRALCELVVRDHAVAKLRGAVGSRRLESMIVRAAKYVSANLNTAYWLHPQRRQPHQLQQQYQHHQQLPILVSPADGQILPSLLRLPRPPPASSTEMLRRRQLDFNAVLRPFGLCSVIPAVGVPTLFTACADQMTGGGRPVNDDHPVYRTSARVTAGNASSSSSASMAVTGSQQSLHSELRSAVSAGVLGFFQRFNREAHFLQHMNQTAQHYALSLANADDGRSDISRLGDYLEVFLLSRQFGVDVLVMLPDLPRQSFLFVPVQQADRRQQRELSQHQAQHNSTTTGGAAATAAGRKPRTDRMLVVAALASHPQTAAGKGGMFFASIRPLPSSRRPRAANVHVSKPIGASTTAATATIAAITQTTKRTIAFPGTDPSAMVEKNGSPNKRHKS